MQYLVAWRIGLQEFALPFTVVQQVVRAVAVTPLSNAPPFVCGTIDIQGVIVPVIDMQKRFRLPVHHLALADHFVIACTLQRTLALWVDVVHGALEFPDEIFQIAQNLFPGVGKTADGLLLIRDLEQCLSATEEWHLNGPLAEDRL